MKKDRKTSADSVELRRRAEARLRAAATEATPARAEADTNRLVHELQVHQVELELQNEELRRSRAEVEAGLERYTELYDFAPVGYVTLGRDGSIRQLNLAGAGMLGAERARLSGRRFGDFVGEADRGGFQAFLEKAFALQAKEVCELALRNEGYGPQYVQLTGTAAQDGQECRVVIADITARKQAEEALSAAEETARQRLMEIEDLYRNAPVGLCVLDRDLRYVRINERLAEINGIPAEAHIGKRVRDLMPELAATVEPEMRRVLETGQPRLNIEIVSETPAQPGTKRSWLEQWLPLTDADGRVTGLSIVVEEITARKLAEAQVSHLASFPMLNPRPVVEVDVAGHVLFCNPVAEQMFPDLNQRGVEHPWLADWQSVMRSLREGGSKAIVREVHFDEKWYHQTMHLVENGKRVRIYGADITARKLAGEALLKANAELEQRVSDRASELAVKIGELRLANAELESRTKQLALLAAELTLAEQRERKRLSQLLHDGLQQHLLSAKILLGGVTELIGDVGLKQATAEIEKIIGESVQLSRSLSQALSPPVLHERGLSGGLEWLVRWMRDKHNFKVDLSIETRPELPEDVRILIFESVRELLINAAKHSKVRRALVSINQVNQAELRIAVSDEGTGFDPRQLKPPGEEGGFGLFSVRERIGLIGGRFEIDSGPSNGSRFILTVPHSLSERCG